MQPFLLEKPVAHSTASKFSAVLIGRIDSRNIYLTLWYVYTSSFDLFDAHPDDGRHERVLRGDERRQIDAERLLDVLHVRLTVGGHLLRAPLVSVEPAICNQQPNPLRPVHISDTSETTSRTILSRNGTLLRRVARACGRGFIIVIYRVSQTK